MRCFPWSMCTRSRLHIALLPPSFWSWNEMYRLDYLVVWVVCLPDDNALLPICHSCLRIRVIGRSLSAPPTSPLCNPALCFGLRSCKKHYSTHAHSCWSSVEPPSARSTTAGLWCSLTVLTQMGFRVPHSSCSSPRPPPSSFRVCLNWTSQITPSLKPRKVNDDDNNNNCQARPTTTSNWVRTQNKDVDVKNLHHASSAA